MTTLFLHFRKSQQMLRKLYIGGLNPSTSVSEITERFSKFGVIKRATIPAQKNPLTSFAFVEIETTEQEYKRALSIYNNRVWKGSTLVIKEAVQDYKVNLLREQAEIRKQREEDRLKSNKISKKKMLRKPVQMLPGDIPFSSRKNWVKINGSKYLPIMKVRSIKTGRVVKLDPLKYISKTHIVLNLPALPCVVSTSNFEIERSIEQDEVMRKRAAIWTHQERLSSKKLLKAWIQSVKKLERDSKRLGKSKRTIMEEEERRIALLKEKGDNLQIVETLFNSSMEDKNNQFREGVVEFFEEDKNNYSNSCFNEFDEKDDSLFNESNDDILFNEKPIVDHSNGPIKMTRSKEDMLAMFSDDD